MAYKKKTARRRRRATGYTVGRAPIRRRKMNGTKRRSYRRTGGMRGITKTIGADAITAAQVGAGLLLSGLVASLIPVKEGGPNWLKPVGVGAAGLLLAGMGPKALRPVGLGITAGAIAIGAKQAFPALPAPMQGLGRIGKASPQQLRQLETAIRNQLASRGTAMVNGIRGDIPGGMAGMPTAMAGRHLV